MVVASGEKGEIMPMTADEIRVLFPKALQLARDKHNFSRNEAANKAHISIQALVQHEGGGNLPNLDNFFDELNAYGLDFMSFHELLLEVKLREQYGWANEIRDINGRIIPERKTP